MITHTTTTATILLTLAIAALSGCGGSSSRSTAGTAAPATTSAPTTTAGVTTQVTTPSATAPTTTATTGTSATSLPSPRPTDPRDELVAVGAVRVHVRCDGAGAVTVLLLPGFEAGADAWESVMPALAERTRVCTYDRPGTGTSDPPGSTQTFATQADDLRSVLDAVGEPGPYVVVGHSFGGVQSVEFTTRYRADVAALVLVDASPTGWPGALCAVADGTDAAAFIQGMCERWVDPTNNVEHLDVFGAFDLVDATPSFGSLPVTVITTVDRELPPGISEGERTRLNDTWNDGQQRWSQLSAVSRVVSVPDVGHNVQIERPDLVVDEIDRLLP